MKQDPKITERKEGELSQMRADYEACREIATLKEHPGWIRIREILETNKKALDAQLGDFQKINEHGIRFILKEKQDFEFVIGLVDNVDERMETLNAEISMLTQKINERKRPAPANANPAPGV